MPFSLTSMEKVLIFLVAMSIIASNKHSQTLVLEHALSQTVQFSTNLFMEKMPWLLNKTSVLDLTTLSCWYLYDQSCISQGTDKGENVRVCMWFSFRTNSCSNTLPERIKFENQGSTTKSLTNHSALTPEHIFQLPSRPDILNQDVSRKLLAQNTYPETTCLSSNLQI